MEPTIIKMPWSVEPKNLGDERNAVVLWFWCWMCFWYSYVPCNVQITANKMQRLLDLFIFADATVEEMELQGTPSPPR
jgi:hypothetical protein